MARWSANYPMWLLAVSVVAPGADLPKCTPVPRMVKMAQPQYPAIEFRVTPGPVSVDLELTISLDGAVTHVRMLATDAPTDAKLFADAALDAARRARFQRVPAPCLYQLRMVFKFVDAPVSGHVTYAP